MRRLFCTNGTWIESGDTNSEIKGDFVFYFNKYTHRKMFTIFVLLLASLLLSWEILPTACAVVTQPDFWLLVRRAIAASNANDVVTCEWFSFAFPFVKNLNRPTASSLISLQINGDLFDGPLHHRGLLFVFARTHFSSRAAISPAVLCNLMMEFIFLISALSFLYFFSITCDGPRVSLPKWNFLNCDFPFVFHPRRQI